MMPTYFGEDATWKTLLYTPEQWRALNAGMMHELFLVFSFLSSLNLEPDEMHILYLGVFQRHFGSVLWLLVYRLMPGSADDNIRQLWSEILDEYGNDPPIKQYTTLTLNSFTDPAKPRGQYPRLKGSAAEVKWIMGPITQAWIKYKRGGNRFDNRVLASLKASLEIRRLIDEASHDAFMELPNVIVFRERSTTFSIYTSGWPTKLINQFLQPIPCSWQVTNYLRLFRSLIGCGIWAGELCGFRLAGVLVMWAKTFNDSRRT